jgi:signal transduction histidine kinase
MFFGAVQVTFLTAVGGFWAVESWQLLTDDLTLIHEQSRRLERALDDTEVVADPGAHDRRLVRVRPRITAELEALRDHAQTLEETERIASLSAVLVGTDGVASRSDVRRSTRDLKRYYDDKVNRARARARFVTRLSTGLFVGIVAIVLGAMMAYFAAIRVWLVRPIQVLSRATGIISTGDLDHRIPVRGRDELGQLASSINGMAASLAENQRRLVQAERFALIGEMSAYVAHNIRNPVASIRATAQTELDHLPPQDPRRNGLMDVVRAADRIVSWVGDLLRYSTPVSLEKSTGDLNAMIAACVDLLRPALAAKGVQVSVHPDPGLPPIALDLNKMEQVFSAVLTNALDASPADATIDVALERRAGPDHAVRAHVRIGDRGDGIPEGRLRTVFTPFATSKKSGTGLGLSLAHKIVTAHQGTISIANREGGGTLVEISLPAGRGS